MITAAPLEPYKNTWHTVFNKTKGMRDSREHRGSPGSSWMGEIDLINMSWYFATLKKKKKVSLKPPRRCKQVTFLERAVHLSTEK